MKEICSQQAPMQFVGNSGNWQIDSSTTDYVSVRPISQCPTYFNSLINLEVQPDLTVLLRFVSLEAPSLIHSVRLLSGCRTLRTL